MKRYFLLPRISYYLNLLSVLAFLCFFVYFVMFIDTLRTKDENFAFIVVVACCIILMLVSISGILLTKKAQQAVTIHRSLIATIIALLIIQLFIQVLMAYGIYEGYKNLLTRSGKISATVTFRQHLLLGNLDLSFFTSIINTFSIILLIRYNKKINTDIQDRISDIGKYS